MAPAASSKLSVYQKPTLSEEWHPEITGIPNLYHKEHWDQCHLPIYKILLQSGIRRRTVTSQALSLLLQVLGFEQGIK